MVCMKLLMVSKMWLKVTSNMRKRASGAKSKRILHKFKTMGRRLKESGSHSKILSKDTELTKVIFIGNSDDPAALERGDYYEIMAVFPEQRERDGSYVCYAHIGQHSSACREYIEEGRLATPEEYRELESELSNVIGYNLDVIQDWDVLDIEYERFSSRKASPKRRRVLSRNSHVSSKAYPNSVKRLFRLAKKGGMSYGEVMEATKVLNSR